MTLTAQFTGSVINDMRERNAKTLVISNGVKDFLAEAIESRETGQMSDLSPHAVFDIQDANIQGGRRLSVSIKDTPSFKAGLIIDILSSGDISMEVSNLSPLKSSGFNADGISAEKAVSKILTVIETLDKDLGVMVTQHAARIWQDNQKTRRFAAYGISPLT